LPSLTPIRDGSPVLTRLGQVSCEDLGLCCHSLGKSLLERRGDPGVQLVPLGPEQRLIGGVLDQGVLEAVNGVGRAAAAEDEFGRDQLVEGGIQLLVGPHGDGGEQLV
jgi:hypothetical protein